MNKSAAAAAAAAALSKHIPVGLPGSRASTISSLSFDDDQQEETQESSWATYTDDVDQQNKMLLCGSFNAEKEYDRTDIDLSCFAKKLHEQRVTNVVNNRMILKMKQGDDELEDTACSPHSSPTVSYMNQLSMMKLQNNSNVQEKMVMQGKLVQKIKIKSDGSWRNKEFV